MNKIESRFKDDAGRRAMLDRARSGLQPAVRSAAMVSNPIEHPVIGDGARCQPKPLTMHGNPIEQPGSAAMHGPVEMPVSHAMVGAAESPLSLAMEGLNEGPGSTAMIGLGEAPLRGPRDLATFPRSAVMKGVGE